MSTPEVNRDSPLGSPKDVYLGIFQSAEQVRRVLEAARELSASPEGQTVFAAPGDETAFEAVAIERIEEVEGTGTFLRKLFAADELETEKIYHDAIRKGAYVVQLQAPEDDKELRSGLEKAMLEAGGRYIHYFGQLVFEAVAINKSPNEAP